MCVLTVLNRARSAQTGHMIQGEGPESLSAPLEGLVRSDIPCVCLDTHLEGHGDLVSRKTCSFHFIFHYPKKTSTYSLVPNIYPIII